MPTAAGAPYLEEGTIIDALEVRDYLARVMKGAGLGRDMSIEQGRKLAEHLIRKGLIDVREAEIQLGVETTKRDAHYEAADR